MTPEETQRIEEAKERVEFLATYQDSENDDELNPEQKRNKVTMIAQALNEIVIGDMPWLLTEVLAKEAQKNQAYFERNQMVLALTKFLPSWIQRHPEDDAEWEDDWRWIVFVMTPDGLQMSWHIHDSDYERYFKDLPKKDEEWDGHDFAEKYDRLRNIKPQHDSVD